MFLGEDNVPPSGEREVCPRETKEYYLEIGDELASKQIVINVRAQGSQPSGQQPPPQQAVPPTDEPLTFTFEPAAVEPGGEVTLHLSRAADVTVYIGGQQVPKKTFDSGRTLVVTMPPNTNDGYVELRGEWIWVRSDKEIMLPLSISNLSFDISLPTDLAVTDLYPTNMPVGQINARLTNRGPQAIIRTQVELVCQAVLSPLPGVFASANPINTSKTYMINIKHNETQIFDTGIRSDTDSFSYSIDCTVRPREDSYFGEQNGNKIPLSESNWGNNTYTERIP